MKRKSSLIAASLISVFFAISVLFGWIFNIGVLKSVIPGYENMKFNTAICLILISVSLYLAITEKFRKTQLALAIIILVIGAASLSENIFSLDLRIDQFFIHDTGAHIDENAPGRMASSTALCFIFFGLAFLFFHTKTLKVVGQVLLHVVTLISFVAILGYILEVPQLYKFAFLASMAIHTAAFLFVLSIVASLLNPTLGFTGLFLGKNVGSIVVRKLFPSTLVVIVLLSVARIGAHRLGLVSVEYGIALHAVSFIIVSIFIFCIVANSLNKIDAERVKAEMKVIEANKNLEALVEQRNSELKAILDSALVSIIGTDYTGTITHFSKGSEVLLGYKAEEIIGKFTPQIIHKPEEISARGSELSRQFNRSIEGFDVFVETAKQGSYESKEWTYVRKDGNTFPVQLVVTALRDKQNNITGFLGVATDISDLKKAKEDLELLANQLQRRNNQLLNFANIISHNLRSPVSNLNVLLMLYKESKTEDEKQILFSKFEIVIHQLHDTLNELTDTLKIQQDVSKEREVLVFEEIMNKILSVLSGSRIENNVTVTYDFSKAEKIFYPGSYLESVMLNLLSNAIKYRSPERTPAIHLETGYINGEIYLAVTDNGLGIDLKKHGKQLFGLNKTFHQHPESKGLGLFITKTQIEAMGGSISAESEVGKGTTFKVLFGVAK